MVVRLIEGDCLTVLPTLEADSLDSCVCDPPYHLGEVPHVKRGGFGGDRGEERRAARSGFMGKAWDGGDIAFRPETWAAVYRVLKPGAYLLAFAGTRTYHRMACAIEDAGFEMRDAVGWLYGSGFPKSLDVGKAIDKAAGVERETTGQRAKNYADTPSGYSSVSGKGGTRAGGIWSASVGDVSCGRIVTAPATPEAAQWSGWGTALKPALELIAVARKPLSESTVASNVLRHGTGAMNIDVCRVEGLMDGSWGNGTRPGGFGNVGAAKGSAVPSGHKHNLGRWPANIIHDGSEEVLQAFAAFGEKNGGHHPKAGGAFGKNGIYGEASGYSQIERHSDTGSAARFFYHAKADRADRAGSAHPTVKPVALIRYLVRLVTRPGGHCLDPFAGSGTLGAAALAEGVDATLIEREAEYADDIRLRLGWNSLAGQLRRNVAARKRLAAALANGGTYG